jgi:hypothetical protein
MQQYTGWFSGVGASVPTPLGVSIAGDYQTGQDRNSNRINVVGVGPALGFNVPGISNILQTVGAPLWEIHGGGTYTWVNGPFSP